VRRALFYAVGGVALWYAFGRSGIHPTISGVLLGLAIPARLSPGAREVLRELADHTSALLRKGADEEIDSAQVVLIEQRLEQLESPLARFVHRLHPIVAFGVMPAFALANSGISLRSMGPADLTASVTLGTALGLLVGKQLGIFTFTLAAVRLGLAPPPGGASLAKLLGVSIVGGIGFTVALFIAALAFRDPRLLLHAKLGILAGSFASGILGATILRATREVRGSPDDDAEPMPATD
jgi:NhaA family Na+:H+ antiporter